MIHKRKETSNNSYFSGTITYKFVSDTFQFLTVPRFVSRLDPRSGLMQYTDRINAKSFPWTAISVNINQPVAAMPAHMTEQMSLGRGRRHFGESIDTGFVSRRGVGFKLLGFPSREIATSETFLLFRKNPP